MNRSVGETAKLLGVSIRTLRYYDEIDLVKPSELSEAGYRYYNDKAIADLEQILFFRELQFSLKDIADMMRRDDYDKSVALARHRELLLLKRRHIDALIDLVDETLKGDNMGKKKVTAADIETAKKNYAAEAAEKWGKTEAYAESQKLHAGYDTDKEVAIAQEANDIFAHFASLMDCDVESEEVQALVADWQAHITKYHYNCTKEILSCLADMYVADERFSENLDSFGDGNAKFMTAAIKYYCTH